MKTITKLKIRRYINRRSNTLIEQIEKVISRLQVWIERLDQEQDLANEAMKAELGAIRLTTETEISRLENQIAEVRAQGIDNLKTTEAEFSKIIDESSREAGKARAIQGNVLALTRGDASFETWKSSLQDAFTEAGWPENYVEQVHDSSWIFSFKEGLTPTEAAQEEMSNGEPE